MSELKFSEDLIKLKSFSGDKSNSFISSSIGPIIEDL